MVEPSTRYCCCRHGVHAWMRQSVVQPAPLPASAPGLGQGVGIWRPVLQACNDSVLWVCSCPSYRYRYTTESSAVLIQYGATAGLVSAWLRRCRRTFKYLMGVATGKWVVSLGWVQDCLDAAGGCFL